MTGRLVVAFAALALCACAKDPPVTCLRSHVEHRKSDDPMIPMQIGEVTVFMPGGTTERDVVVCDAWERCSAPCAFGSTCGPWVCAHSGWVQ